MPSPQPSSHLPPSVLDSLTTAASVLTSRITVLPKHSRGTAEGTVEAWPLRLVQRLVVNVQQALDVFAAEFTLVALGNHQEALRIFRSTGSEPDARFNLGVAFERAGRPTSAVLQYEHAVNISPQHELANDALSRLRNEIRLNPE